MTTEELEKKFFETFDIELRVYCSKVVPDCTTSDCKDCNFNSGYYYPEIADRKILELLCICNKHGIYGYSDYGGEYLVGETVEELKENLLENCVRVHMIIYDDVRNLFDA